MDFIFNQQPKGFKPFNTFKRFDSSEVFGHYGIGDLLTSHWHSGGPRIKQAIRQVADPTRLMLSPDMAAGSGGAAISNIYGVIENKDYNFIVSSPSGYVVGSGPDRNFFKLNSGKAPITITGPFTGRWLMFNPTLVRLGYAPSNTTGVVRISAPANLAGYEIPLRLLKKV